MAVSGSGSAQHILSHLPGPMMRLARVDNAGLKNQYSHAALKTCVAVRFPSVTVKYGIYLVPGMSLGSRSRIFVIVVTLCAFVDGGRKY